LNNKLLTQELKSSLKTSSCGVEDNAKIMKCNYNFLLVRTYFHIEVSLLISAIA